MAKRETKKVIKGVTLDEFESALSQYANADARESQVTAKMEIDITAIRDQHAGELSRLAVEKENAFPIIQTYCEERPDLFADRKSLETLYGIVGFRTGTPQIKTRTGFTWKKVLKLVKEKLPGYIRTKEEIDKKTLLAHREREDVQKGMLLCGMRITADESFYIELKTEVVA
ncbi:hypothetical protein GFS24_10340 [Chitinophaga sp. SYP-B3965]|uniref:host-nuclease inhibitor Gam family protein n=1 Tax=Chitinophaga sp. SYP-B3965 TaxID=2663120 RepID=UPI0012999CC9|nr:host-nuclease inhibitor Gam family protein [Chitinophaga sp. SYP-B3965]MRG45515.1 hypothetical protein [Chitinophaga sp. SYP-B3965]